MTDTMASMMMEMKKMREENNEVKYKMGLGHYEVVYLCYEGHQMEDATYKFLTRTKESNNCLKCSCVYDMYKGFKGYSCLECDHFYSYCPTCLLNADQEQKFVMNNSNS